MWAATKRGLVGGTGQPYVVIPGSVESLSPRKCPSQALLDWFPMTVCGGLEVSGTGRRSSSNG